MFFNWAFTILKTSNKRQLDVNDFSHLSSKSDSVENHLEVFERNYLRKNSVLSSVFSTFKREYCIVFSIGLLGSCFQFAAPIFIK
jgi:hypothetical protein